MVNKQTTITVGVQFEAAANSYANIVKEFQGAFKSINLDSTVGKQLNRIVNSMGEKLQQARTIISGGVGSEITNKEMTKFLSLLESMNTMANRFQYTMNNINVDSLNLDAGEIARLKQARNEVSKLATQIENLQNNSATIGQLFKGDTKSAQTLKATNAGIKDSFTLSQALDAAKQKYADLGKEAKNAALGLSAANQALAAAKQYVAQLQNQTKEGAGKQAIADALAAPLTKENVRFKLATAITRQQATGETNPFENSWYVNRSLFGQYFRKNADGTFSDKLKPGGKEALETYLTELGLDDKQISSIVKNAENRYARLQAELTKVFQDKKIVDSFGKYAVDTNRALAQQGQQSWTAEMANAKAQEAAIQKEVNKYTTASTTANQAMTTTQEAIKILEQRIANQDKEIEELQVKLAGKIQDEASVESGLRNKYSLPGGNYSGQARGITNAARQEADARREEQRLAAEAEARQNQAAQEAQQFQDRLQFSLKQWMGFSQIINITRNGIRNAIQDIQSLDKAMTNIAVVTDMSISDLWGKINEYMSIAQQYGVTTQGVYEVSQLFYQQGLATADVMELTTETLKMARIAGMGYSEAADAMTVAIRGFKMEMSDAQRVTDVYSEVAAVTASDTQELATAMSKTASSAASVGMSFENTTAMIATMVEATRESATNIGSAMKSIISRMSEMKQGLTQDEDGEFLDASKVETALKTVKVALRDTQGQFRDLDQVILELGAKWSTLDSATKRYLGTVIAGNRQQSRFLALMENYDRLVEIQNAAMDSEDASVLQYAKTLDSLESKLNQISNSFQQFYMSIVNGPVIGSFLSIINNVITNLSSLPKLLSITKILSYVSQIKTVIQLVFNLVSSGFAKIATSTREWRNSLTGETSSWAERLGQTIAASIAKGIKNNGSQISGAIEGSASGANVPQAGNILDTSGKGYNWGKWLYAGGAALSTIGLGLSQSTDAGYNWSTALSTAGGAATTVGMALTGNVPGAIIQGLNTVWELTSRLLGATEARIERLSQQLEKDNVQRVEDKTNAKTLSEYIEKEAELRAARYDSAEAMEKYLEVSNEIAEKYPQYTSYIDESGNAIVNMSMATEDLKRALDAAADSSRKWGKTAIELAQEKYDKQVNKLGYNNTVATLTLGSIKENLTETQSVDLQESNPTLYKNFEENLNALSVGEETLKNLTYVERVDKINELLGSSSLQDAIEKTSYYTANSAIPGTSNGYLSKLFQDVISVYLGNGALQSDGNGHFTLSEDVAELLRLSQELEDAKKTALSSNVYSEQQRWNFSATSSQKRWAQENNISSYVNSIATQNSLAAKSAKEYIDNFSQEQYQELVALLESNFIKFTGESRKLFEAYQEKPESITADELGQLIGVDDLNDQVQDAIIARWIDNVGLDYVAFEKAVGQQSDIISYSEWLAQDSNRKDSNEAKREYYDAYIKGRQGLGNLLTASTMRLYTDWFDKNEEIIKADSTGPDAKVTEGQKKVAEQAEDIINKLVNDINSSQLDAIKKTELFTALFTDTGTFTWASKFESLAEKYGLELQDSVYNAVYESLDSMINSAVEQAKSAMTKAEELSGKQSSGMSFEDASNYLRKLDWSDRDISQVYDIQNGKYYFKNYQEAQAAYLKSEQDNLARYQEQFNILRDNKNARVSSDGGRTFSNDVLTAINSLPEGGLKDAALEWRKENALIADDWEAFQAWVESRAKEAAETADALDEQISQLTKTTNLNSYKDRIQKFKANLTPDVFNEDWWKSIGSDTEWMESGVDAESIKAHLPKGWIFNTITGELTRSIEAIQRDINLSTSEEEKAHFKTEMESAKKSLAETIGEYTGRVTQEQINYLQSQNIDVSGLESSKEWTKESVQKIADQFIEKGLIDVANQILVDFANNSREQAKSIKSSASSLLSDVANTSIEDLVSFMRNVLNNQEWAPDSTQLKEMTDALDGGTAGMIDYLNRQSTQYGIDLSVEIASFTEQQASSIKDSMEKVLTSLAQGEEVLVNDIVSVWESITNKQAGATEREAIEKAMSQGWQAVADLLRNAIATSGLAADFANGLQDILASVIDAIRSEINSVVSGIKSGFSGSLSRAEISEIAKNTGLGEKSILFGATQSLSGYKLSQNALLQLAGATSDKYGYGYDIAKTLVDEGIIKSYDEVNVLLKDAQENTDKWGDQTKEVMKILKDVQGIMENSTTNDSWFNPDYYGEVDDKFQDYLDKVVKASPLLQSIQKGDKISRSDSEFMLQIVSQSDSFQKALKGNQKSIEDFYAALANHTDITTGAQDFSAALADMGMSFEDFGNSFAESVSNFADKRIEQLEAMKAMLLSQEQFADAMAELASEGVNLFEGIETATSSEEAVEAVKTSLKTVEDSINTEMEKYFGEGATFKSVYGSDFTDIMLDAFNLTPEKMATFNSDQQKSVNEAAKAYMGFWAEAMSDPNNWVANDPIASFAKMMSQANAKWEQYTIDNPDTLTWYENPQLSADTTQFDEQVQQLRSSLQAKLEDISQGLDKNTPKLDVELGAISDKNKLQELDKQANKIKALRDELVNNPTAATQEQLNAAIEEYNKMAEAAKKSAQDSQNALKETQKQVKELSDQLSALEKTYTARVNANVSSALSAVRSAIASINRMTATIQVNANVNSSSIKDTIKNTGKVSTTSSLKKPSTTDKYINKVYYTGNVNGLALYNGTKIAGKTLVGELGPEMAVYNNAFHILGQGGAEFVDLPDDAIVFNHKQTEGIINGQAGYRGKTVNGGPAFAKGSLAAAIAAIDKEIALWRSMKDLTLSDMLGGSGGSGGGGGGGSGNTLKAHIEDLVEWYNLSRQIADIEQKINNIIAERENITDGHEYLRSLREQQHLLEGQVLTQRTLLGYQQKQLELQAEQINTNPIWSKFFEVDANGLLQYVMGNEVNGGKGTLSVLQQLNQMSGEQQLAYIKGTGYSYIDNDGNVLDGEELIAQFYTEAQEQIDKYDELRDTVEETDEALSKLQTSIDEIEQEIRKNQEDLEQAIYDSIVSAWEKQISDLTEQMNLLKEANDAYVNGLSDALAKEKNLYSQNQSTADREQLQRQLSLLRRAGGSASQIADLEEQLNDSLKNEYFSHQQDSIDSIKEANQKQIDALNKQIKIQQETLDFQKENGVLWSKVYEILTRSDNEILEFLKGNNSDFFSKSALVQRDMLEEWAKQIGIYKENNDVGYIGNINTANENFVAEAWNSAKGADKQKMFDVLDKTTQAMLQDYFAGAFANAKLQGMGSEDAYEYARNDMYQKLYQAYNQKINADSRNLTDARANSQPTVSPSGGGSGGDYGSGGGGSGGGYSGGGSSTSRISITVSAGNTGGYPTLASSGGGTSASVSAGTRVVIAPNAKSGYAFDYITYNGTKKSSMSIVPTGNVSSISIRVFYKRTGSTKHIGGSPSGDADHRVLTAASGAFVNRDNQPALLHKGEGVFTAQQTSALISLVDNYQKLASGNISASLIASLSGATRNYSNINARNNAASSVVVNPGAVVIQVDQLNDKYDVDDLATDVFNKITTIASKATNRGVNRR